MLRAEEIDVALQPTNLICGRDGKEGGDKNEGHMYSVKRFDGEGKDGSANLPSIRRVC